MSLYSHILTQILITVVSVSGGFVLTGMTGMFSLGQAAFMAIGAYTSGILVTKLAMPIIVAWPAAVLLAVLVGLIVGLPTVRLRRDYISLVTLGFGEAITALLNRATTITGGASGLTGIPKRTTLLIAFVSAAAVVTLISFFKSSKYGRQCIAVRSDELAAKSMGINVPRVKMIAFLISVAVTAYGGCLYAFYTAYVDPTLFGWQRSAEWIIMVFFGGVNSLTGSILSTFVLSGLPEVLRFLQSYRAIIYAVLVLLVINFRPSGMLGEWELTPKHIKRLFKRPKGARAQEVD